MNLEAKDPLAVIEDVREYLAYLRELGVDGVATARNDQNKSIEKPPSPSIELAATKPWLSSGPQPERKQVMSDSSRSEQDFLFGDVAAAPDGGLAPSSEALEDIWADIGECTRCPLCTGRTNVVNTHGNRKARLMFVGEAPGADEDAQARPFVGRAGQLLTKIIEAMGLTREEVLIGNVNRCRPPGNRQPTMEEAAVCKPFLLREISVVQPEVIVVMGNTAMKNLLDTREGITRLRGQFQTYRGIKVMPTFHPAYLLRDPSKKRETWEDMKKVREYLGNSPAKLDAS